MSNRGRHERGPERSRTAETVPASVVDWVKTNLCAGEQSSFGPYTGEPGKGEVLLPETLYLFRLGRAGKQVFVHVFGGLGDLGGELWEREVRSLLRLSYRRHPALPNVLEGSFDPEEGLAFLVTEAAANTLGAGAGFTRILRANRLAALQQFTQVADALALMHGQGLYHRNLCPRAIEVLFDESVFEEGGIPELHLRIARFEMSALVANLLRRVRPADARRGIQQDRERVRGYYLDQSDIDLACFPPERLGFLFPDSGRDRMETDRSDVWALGVLAYLLFVGDLPADQLRGTFTAEGLAEDRDARLHEAMRSELTQLEDRKDLPGPLAEMLRVMLDPDPRTRVTSYQVVDGLTREFDRIAARLAPAEATQPFVLGFMPKKCRETFLKWGWIDFDPVEEAGRLELKAFLENDLHGGTLLYSPNGFRDYNSKQADEDAQVQAGKARYVLLGVKGAYFCAIYNHPVSFSPYRTAPVPEVLVVKYIKDRERIWRLEEAATYKRRLPSVDVQPVGQQYIKPADVAGRSFWKPYLDSVKEVVPVAPWLEQTRNALNFFLDLQNVQLAAKEYAYEVEGPTNSDVVTLRWDEPRERDRRFTSDLFTLYCTSSRRRPRFGDFFEALDAERVAWHPDSDGSPRYGRDLQGIGRVYERLDASRIRVRHESGRPFRRKGWLRPEGDLASGVAINRQRDACAELIGHEGLLEQIHRPHAPVWLPDRWEGAGEGLLGSGADVVTEMLGSRPFYAAHGPPGTGKTTVASRAIMAALRENPANRILVTSQSHFSLDNLARGILKALRQLPRTDVDWTAIRIASRHAEEKVHDEIRGYLPPTLAATKVEEIQAHCRTILDDKRYDPPILDLVQRWLALAAVSQIELQDRLQRGANLVFVTCSGATPHNVDAVGDFGVYDWVVVEEAAKAWPTELFIPLVRGIRWALIGDHKQLPAFGRDEVEQLLEECRDAPPEQEDLHTHGEAATTYARVYDLFRTLFGDKDLLGRPRQPVIGARDPRGELKLQFRMHETIAGMVSRAFYKRTLSTHESANRIHPLREPPVAEKRQLLWLDTGRIDTCVDQPCWSNAGEAEAVARLMTALKPRPRPRRDGYCDDPIAILTPYHAQRRKIERALASRGAALRGQDLRGLVHTVDSFQGKEADIVLISLVRSQWRKSELGSFGHLLNAQRTNVMLSRARMLLVLVGDYRHFKRASQPFWKEICHSFELEQAVHPAADVLGRGGWR